MAAEARHNSTASTVSLGSHFLDDTVMTTTNTIDEDIVHNHELADQIADCLIATRIIMEHNPGPHPLLQQLQKQLEAVERLIIYSRQAAQEQAWLRMEEVESEEEEEEEEEMIMM